MGYEKPSTKLTFYKAFFSSQWKFLIHTILQSLSAKRTSWNEFSTAMASAVICLSKGQKFNFSKHIFDSLVRNVDSSSKFYMYSCFIQLIIQNQVRDLSTHTTRFISPTLTQKVFANMRRVGKGFSGVETPLFEGMLAVRQPAEEEVAEAQVQVDAVVAAAIEENVPEDVAHDAIPSPPPHDIPSPSQEPSLPPQQQQRRTIDDMDMNEGIELVKDVEVTESEGRHVAQQAEKQAEIYNLDLDHSSKVLSMQEDDSEVQEVVEPTIPVAAPTVVSAYTRRRKGVIIRDPEEESPLETPDETPKVKDKGKGILVETSKPMKKKDQIELDAEYRLEVVEDEDDDVFVEATPLASKVPVMDYQIVLIDNKPRFKIIRADETHQFYISFTTLLNNFDREDLENGQDAIWRNQKSVHGLTLVKRWKLLTSCGVHVITLSTVQLFLLVERRRLGHMNFKTMNKLVRSNLVKGLPSKSFENDHSCVACLKGKQHKASHNTDFHQIVDFFEVSHIRYALTVYPTVNVSHIRQFWSTARVKTTDGETKILAKVNGRQRTVSESSIRRHLKLNDEEVSKSKSTSFNEFSSNIATALVCLAINRTYNFSKMIFDGMMRNVKNETAFPTGDVRYEEAFFIVTRLDAGQDRENIAKTSAMPHEALPRVTSLDGGEDLLVGDTVKDINKSADKGSDSTDKMANVLGTLGATNILASGGLRSVFTTTSTGVSPAIATASGSFPTAPSKEKVLEQMSVQLDKDLEAKFSQEDQIIREQAKINYEMARIHAERELEMMIVELDKSNEMVAKYLSEYEQAKARLSHDEKEKMQDFVSINSKLESERLKRRGIRLDNESFKKLKTAEASADQNDQSVLIDDILNDEHSEHSNHTNDEQIIDNLPNTKEIQISEHLSSLSVEDTSVHNTIPIPILPLPIPSMVTLAPQYRWSKDKHIKLVNIIGNPRARMLTRSMAKELSAALAHECLFIDFLSEEEPKKVSEALKHPGWVDAMQEELNQFARNKVWTLVPIPYGKTIIGSKWVFRKKEMKLGLSSKTRQDL
nr:retrovirus-related Pol polyprotein from transposon TNT 1-94 [Tanacetum cinerariifolium]